jgi:hypothetical protein
VVTTDAVTAAMAGRAGRSLVLVDLAVPRDVDPRCGDVPDVAVFDIAALRERVASHSPETAADIARAHELVSSEVRRVFLKLYPAASEAIVSRRPGIGVVFISGYTADVIVDHGVLEEDVLLLQKPFDAQSITAKIQAAIRAARNTV